VRERLKRVVRVFLWLGRVRPVFSENLIASAVLYRAVVASAHCDAVDWAARGQKMNKKKKNRTREGGFKTRW
jgi:hypothetical protein